MRFKTVTSPHGFGDNRVSNVMLNVIYALLPGTIAMIWFFGWGVLINIVVAILTAWVCEAAVLSARKQAVLATLQDNSALVSAWLLALALPPLAPWWIPVIGSLFAILFAKQLYGGLGYNPFNPAMVGYVVLLIAFPLEMTQWILPSTINNNPLDFQQTLNLMLFDQLPAGGWDALSGATPLDKMKTDLGLLQTINEVKQDSLFTSLSAEGWQWVAVWYLAGGLYLIYRKIISWHTPVSVLLGLAIAALIFNLINPEYYTSALFHLFSGGAMLGAFFIATDPVSSCTSNKGKLVYGAGIGLLTYIIRTWGGYPDGIAFAVLLMNMAAPFIDHYTKPRVFGAVND